jgi:hypothetical protein
MQGTMEQEIVEQETKKQRERRIMTRTLDKYVEKYKASTDDNERARIDKYIIEFLHLLAGNNFAKYWDYYDQAKNS